MTAFFSDELQKLVKEVRETKRSLQEARNQLNDKVTELEMVNIRMAVSEKELRGKVGELNRNQQAMLNVLEDAGRLEKKLRKEHDLTQAVISSMKEGLLVVDKEHKIILINQAASVLLRWAPTDALNQSVNSVFILCKGNKRTGEACHLPIDQLIREPNIIGINLEDDFYCYDKEGRSFPIIATMASLMKGSVRGEISGAVIVFRNVTKEKSLDSAKTSFISVASHQLRTPLTSIRWFSEMLLDGDAGDLDGEQRHFVQRIHQGADRMINLVNLLLQIARVEAGRVRIDPMPVNLKLLTEGVIISLQDQIREKDQKVEVSMVPETLPKIPLDEDVIWQIVQNILTNAIRYSPHKSVIKVKITAREEKKEVLYSVEDKGIGIPKNEQGRIFEKFYRADNAVKYVPEGSGLGLNLAKMLVEDWDGKTWFESEEGKGSTFFFTVPLEGMKAREGEVKLKV